ncbi:ribosomal-like protein [Monosporozyma unispora]|nr:ribosomal-like protein [Kazachstania unispora]
MSDQAIEKKELNSTPEILLRKRRNADRTRLEKQELAKQKLAKQNKIKSANKNKFIRAESIVANTLATEREKERIKRISKVELKKLKNDLDHLPSDKDFILNIIEKTPEQKQQDEEFEKEDEDEFIREKIVYDGKPTLLFVLRVKGPTNVNIPHKAFKILNLLRLQELDTGVFVKLTKTTYPLLRLIAPYIVIGKPSLQSVRSLIQKRSKILYQRDTDPKPVEIILNDNNIVEEKLGEFGIICIEDIIHEINSLGENFQSCNFFLQPFKLNKEASGFNSLTKLKKIEQREQQKKTHKISNSSVAPIIQIDIDNLLSKLN